MDLEGQLGVHYIESKTEKSFLIFIFMQQFVPQNICSPTVTESASVPESSDSGTLRRWQPGVRRVAVIQRLDGPLRVHF